MCDFYLQTSYVRFAQRVTERLQLCNPKLYNLQNINCSLPMSKSIKSYLTFEIDYLPDKINFRSKKQEKKP